VEQIVALANGVKDLGLNFGRGWGRKLSQEKAVFHEFHGLAAVDDSVAIDGSVNPEIAKRMGVHHP